MPAAGGRAIDPAIQVLPGTDIADVWDRFEVFEALHHNMQICNPMSSDELDDLIDAIGLTNGMRLLDVACGYGEVLMRAASRAAITGIGIDLSPWMITAAHALAQERQPASDLMWVLGEARDFGTDPSPDVAICIGAEWVWHDFAGTVRALGEHLKPGGVAVIGAARLHESADQARVRRERGRVETIADMEAVLRDSGFSTEHRIDPSDDGWDNYLDRTNGAAQEWATLHPGPRSDQWLEEQADWQLARERDRDIIGWSVWVARL